MEKTTTTIHRKRTKAMFGKIATQAGVALIQGCLFGLGSAAAAKLVAGVGSNGANEIGGDVVPMKRTLQA